jgi:hypothetical protein
VDEENLMALGTKISELLLEICDGSSPLNPWRVFAADVGNPALTTALETVNQSRHYKGEHLSFTVRR